MEKGFSEIKKKVFKNDCLLKKRKVKRRNLLACDWFGNKRLLEVNNYDIVKWIDYNTHTRILITKWMNKKKYYQKKLSFFNCKVRLISGELKSHWVQLRMTARRKKTK